MGKITNGLLGGFSGTVGTVVGGNWKGIHYIRSKPVMRSGKPTPGQLAHRARFRKAMGFVKAMHELLLITWRDHSPKMTVANMVFSQVMKHAITGVYPNFHIDYSRVVVASGKLTGADNPSVAGVGAGNIRFGWNDNSGTELAKAGDRAIVVVYCEELNQCVFDMINAVRSQATAVITVPAFNGKIVYTWLSFLSGTGLDVAASVYSGKVTVS